MKWKLSSFRPAVIQGSATGRVFMLFAAGCLFWSPLNSVAATALSCEAVLGSDSPLKARAASQNEAPYSKLEVLDSVGRPSIVANLEHGTVDWQTPLANRLMQIYFTESRQSSTWLPERVAKWLDTQTKIIASGGAPAPLKIGHSEENLTLEIKHHTVDGSWIVTMRLYDSETVVDSFSKNFGLTKTESEILLWASRGKTNKDIADILESNDLTVKKHMERVLSKMGVETRTAAAHMALKAEAEAVVTEPLSYVLSQKAKESAEIKVRVEILQNRLELLPRDAEILYWLAMGLGQRQIASIFETQPLKIKLQIEEAILPKLKLTREQAIAQALKVLPSLSRYDDAAVPPSPQAKIEPGSENRTGSVSLVPAPKAPTTLRNFSDAAAAAEKLAQVTVSDPLTLSTVKALMDKFSLTPKGAEVLYWLVQGKTDNEIKEILGLASKGSVTARVAIIYDKIGVYSRESLTRLARPLLPQSMIEALDRTLYSKTAFENPEHMQAIHIFDQRLSLDPVDAEILLWVTLGKKSEEIASITHQTLTIVSRRLGKIYSVLGVKNRPEAVEVAINLLPKKQTETVTQIRYSSAALENVRILEKIQILEKAFPLKADEAEILYWVTLGKTNEQITEILKGTDRQSVADKLSKILKKINATDRVKARVLALEKLPPEFSTEVDQHNYSETAIKNPAAIETMMLLKTKFKLNPDEAEILYWTVRGETQTQMVLMLQIGGIKVNAKLASALSKMKVDSLPQAETRISEELPKNIVSAMLLPRYNPSIRNQPQTIKTVNLLRQRFSLDIEEAEVLYLVAKYEPNASIATAYDLNIKSVVRRCTSIFKKMGVNNREEAAEKARQFFDEQK